MPGKKQTLGKIPYHLLSIPALEETARVLGIGADKYEVRGWEGGINYGKAFQAVLRHLFKWWSGHDTDDETGLNHLAHASCMLMMLLHFEKCRPDYRGFDDRPKNHSIGVSNDGNPAKQEGLE